MSRYSLAGNATSGCNPGSRSFTRILFFILLTLPVMQAIASGDKLTGIPRVVDGDTLELSGTKIRLHGIDAPESTQWCLTENRSYPCGRNATDFLAAIIGNSAVSCIERDRDRYGRVVAECYSGNTNLNRAMVLNGWALAYRQYSRDFVAAEQQALAEQNGIWQGQFVKPWLWRKGQRLPEIKPQNTPTTGCLIKGNINSKGRRIYHVPGGASYNQTKINQSKGERWFCSEKEAVQAGWVKAKR